MNQVENQKIRLIHNADVGSGFTALMVYALNGVRKAVQNDELPVVNYDQSTTPDFYDVYQGENIWEYFFEPVAGVSYQQLQQSIEAGTVSESNILQYSAEEIYYTHLHEEGRIATFWSTEPPKDKARFMSEKRALGRSFVRKYIHVKPHITQKVNDYKQTYFKPDYFIIGVHIRGTDFSYAQPTNIETYFSSIDAYIQEQELKNYQIFLATDQEQFVDLFQKRYAGKMITYDALRSKNDISPFQFKNASGYRKGEDVLIDILLLSASNYLFKGAAAVGEMALWFNEELVCKDFGLQSDYEGGKRFYLLKSAYLKLNIDKKGTLGLRLRELYIILIKLFYRTSPFKQILRKYQYYRGKKHGSRTPNAES